MNVSVDLALFAPCRGRLAVLVRRAKGRHELPWALLRTGESPRRRARSLAAELEGAPSPWLAQVGALGGSRRGHPGGADVSVAFLAVIDERESKGGDLHWVPVDALPALSQRQRGVVDAARVTLRRSLDASPAAFRLLPVEFTLGELQRVYELVLGRRLHKASFRRALEAASVVAATGRWRREGRGRPAQLFHYSPRRRRAPTRAVRFDGIAAESYQVETEW